VEDSTVSLQESYRQALERLLTERYSCRAFRPEPVPRATIEAILTLAQRTASWSNCQPWQVVVASGAAVERFRHALYDYAAGEPAPTPDFAFPRAYNATYMARRRVCGFQLYEAVGVKRGDKAGYTRQGLENFRLFGAAHVALLLTDADMGTYGAVDCGIYLGTFLLAAQAHGVAAVAQASLAMYAPFVRAHFNLPDHLRLVCGVSFGYAETGHPINGYRTHRADLSEAVTWVEG